MSLSFFSRLKVNGKLMLLIGSFALGFAIFAATAWFTLDKVKIAGNAYNEILRDKDLISDISPPPAFALRPYLNVLLMVNAETPAEFQAAKTVYNQTKLDFAERHEHWAKELPDDGIKRALANDTKKPAEEFFRIVDTEILPALEKNDSASARKIVAQKLAPLYAEHRSEVLDLVKSVNQRTEQTIADATSLTSSRIWSLLIVSTITVLVVGGLSIWIRRSLLSQEKLDLENNAKLAAISKAQAVIEFNLDGTIITANENFCKTLGYSLDEIKGKHHSLFVEDSEKNSPQYREFWAKLNRGENQPGEFRRVGKGGKLVVISASYNPIVDLNGKIVKVVKYASDVTEMAKSREEAARVNSMMEQAPINVMFADRDFTIRYANPATVKTLKTIEHLIPIRADQLIGQSIDIFHKRPDHQRRLLADPKNLPHRAQIQVGPETLDLLVSPIFDGNKNFLGSMVTWEVITQKLKMEQDVKDGAERDQKKAEEMAKILDQVNASANMLGSSAEELTSVSTQMASNAEETSAQANVVSAASEQVSKNVQVVATGVEEMNSAIREIAKNASDAARVSQQAVTTAATANTTISKLGDSSAEIGKVIKVITSIAEQTNLLALNATIEAARAGEAGKGFAVVANEVKELAKETAKATEDISRKIEAIQGDTDGAVDSIRKIGEVIAQINDISNTIASAVEEQTATANEMSRNVAEAAKGTSEIAQNITSVAQAAQDTTQGANNCQQAASELARMAAELQQLGAGGGSSTETGHPAPTATPTRNVQPHSAKNGSKNNRPEAYVPASRA